MTALDWFITLGSFGCFVVAYAWLCIEASRNISAGRESLDSTNSDQLPYALNHKCPVVTPPAGMGNTASGSRPGRISTGGAEVRKRALAAGKHAEKSAPATHIAGPTDRPARRSIVHWLAFHGGIK